MSGSKALLAVLVMAAGLVALATGLREPYRRAAVDHWKSKLSSASDEEVPLRIREVTDQEEIGLRVLIDALDSPRENIARAARQSLLDQLARWQSLDDAQSAEKLAQLSRRLGDAVAGFGPRGLLAANELAAKMLAWRPAHDPGDRSAIIAVCETVLTLPRTAQPKPPKPRVAAFLSPEVAPDPLAREEPGLDRVTTEMARLPGGALQIESFPDAPRLAPDETDMSAAARPLSGENPLRESTPGQDGAAAFANTAPVRLATAEGDAQSLGAMSLAKGIGDAPEKSPRANASSSVELAAADVVDVMRLLQDTNPKTAAAASDELRRRTFGDVQIDLARRLFTSDSQVRRELARALPTLRSVDPTPWLLWLARDEDAEVRLAAISLMATGSDPRLLGEIERMAAGDADPRIRRCAEQLQQQRQSTTAPLWR